MADCVAPPTDPNKESKSTPNPRESRKRARVTSSPPAGSEIEKRMKQTSHPHSDAVLVTLPMSTAGFSADLPTDINQLKENLDSLDEQTLRLRARDLADAADYYRGIALHDSAELAATKARFDEYRIRFADKIFEAIPTNSANVRAAGSASGPEQVTIVATVQEDKMGEKITTEMIDKILGAKKNGPVPQTIQRKDNLVYMSFADAVQSGKAKAILESNPAGSSLFQVVNSRKRLFPAVARSVDLVDLEELRRDLILRNGSLCNSLEEVRPLFRGRDGTVGHVRLLFASAAERDELVRRGRIYAGGRRIVVTAVEWNKEVRRCDAVPTSFTCIQANLRHSHAASASFSQLLLDLNIDVALVQEPYAAPGRCDTSSRPSIDYLPEDYESFHNLGADHLYGAAIFARRSLRASIIQTFSSSHAVCVRISSRDSQLIFASVYLRPSTTSINSSLSTIFTACSPLQYAIKGKDANARSPLWNSRQLDNKGRELEGLLGLANRPLNDFKFIPPGTSFIDVTLHGCCTDVMDWRFLDLPSLSDHPLIYFRSCTAGGRGQLTNSTSAPTIPPRQKRIHLPPAQSICVERYTTALNDALHTPPSLVNKEDIDHCVKSLETNIQSSARRFGYYSRERKELKKKMPWWTKDLWGLRNRLRNAYNRACDGLKDGIRTPAVNAYRTLKAEYQRELRRAELASFKSFSADLSNDLSAALKAIKEESQPSITFPTKLKPNLT